MKLPIIMTKAGESHSLNAFWLGSRYPFILGELGSHALFVRIAGANDLDKTLADS